MRMTKRKSCCLVDDVWDESKVTKKMMWRLNVKSVSFQIKNSFYKTISLEVISDTKSSCTIETNYKNTSINDHGVICCIMTRAKRWMRRRNIGICTLRIRAHAWARERKRQIRIETKIKHRSERWKKEENSNLEFAMLKCLYDIIQKGCIKKHGFLNCCIQ